MKNFRIVCLILSLGVLVFHLFRIDYEDLRFKTNMSQYSGIFAMALVSGSFLIGIVKDRNNK